MGNKSDRVTIIFRILCIPLLIVLAAFIYLQSSQDSTKSNSISFSLLYKLMGKAPGTFEGNYLKMTRQGGVFSSYISYNGTSWRKVGDSVTGEFDQSVYVGLGVCSHNRQALCSADFELTEIQYGSIPDSLTDGLNNDLGLTGIQGSVSRNRSIYTVKGAGEDLLLTEQDSFHYLYKKIEGDFSITVRVLGMENTDPGAKAGIIVRQNLEPSSPSAALVLTPDETNLFLLRTQEGMEYYDLQKREMENVILRKTAHFMAFMLLALLLYNIFSLTEAGTNKKIIATVVLSLLFAAADEFHQSFSAGRGSSFTDVILDTSGTLCGIFLILFARAARKKTA